MVLGFLGSIASSLLPGLFSGGVAKTVGDIGKRLIMPIGSKLLSAGVDAITNLLGGAPPPSKSIAEQAREGLERGGRQAIQYVRKKYRPQEFMMMEAETPQVTGIQDTSFGNETRIPGKTKKRRRQRIPQEEPEENQYEGVKKIFTEEGNYPVNPNKRDYETS